MGSTTARYTSDKPRECKYCYFWGGAIKGCTLGEENCNYLIPVRSVPVKKTKCTGCPYGKHKPCIGWCTKDILQK